MKKKEDIIAFIDSKIEETIANDSMTLHLNNKEFDAVSIHVLKAALYHYHESFDYAVKEFPTMIMIEISHHHPLVTKYHGERIGEVIQTIERELLKAKELNKPLFNLTLRDYGLNIFVQKSIISYLEIINYDYTKNEGTISVKLK